MSLANFKKVSRLCADLMTVTAKVAGVKDVQMKAIVPRVQKALICTSCIQCQQQKNMLTRNYSNHLWLTPSQKQSFATIAKEEDGVFNRMWKGLGFTGKLQYRKSILQAAGLRLYLCCAELIDYESFFKELELPDTLNSWFRITELHIWMCIVRLAEEKNEGKFVRNNMIRFMWQDVEKRSKKLGTGASSSQRREGIQALSEHFKSALLAYDEGILDNDMVLAGALWRQLLEMKCDDPEKLELVVGYVRKQIAYLDRQEPGVLLTSGLVQFLPLKGEEDRPRTKQILQEILRRF